MIGQLRKYTPAMAKFCTVQQPIQKKKSKKGLYAILVFFGIGFASQYRMYQNYLTNIFLHPEQLAQLKRERTITVDKQSLIHHPINEKVIKGREVTVIIGAGIIGLSQALKLLQNGHSVIVVEREQFVATQCSAFNGNIYNPYLFNPLISKYSMKTMLNNYLHPSDTATQRFSFNSLREYHSIIWLLNTLILSITDAQFDQAIIDMNKLGRIQEQELEKIKKIGLLENQLTAQGELSFYQSTDYGKKISDSFKKANIQHSEESLASFKGHSINEKLFQNFPYVLKLEKENNIDTKLLSLRTLNYCEKNYPDQFRILYGTEFKDFVLNYDRRVLGINTNNGIVFGNKFVICGGLHSKYIAKKLAITLPIMPCRGWVIESELPEHAQGSVLDKMVLKLPTLSVTNLNGKLRISGCQSIDEECKSNDPINEWGAQLLIQQMKELFNIELDMTKISVRDCCRPLTPDDKMILCRLDPQNNVYVNAGHGSRGMSLCHGCAEVIYQIMKGNRKEYEEFDVARFLFV